MLIGLHSERSRVGKDSVAAILVRKYGFRQVALATAIREILLDLDPWLEDASTNLVDLHDWAGGDWDKIKAVSTDSVEWMIKLGQSARNNISEDVWIEAAFPEPYWRHEHIVISDIRQPNEVTFLHRNGGELWYVERPGVDDSNKRGMDGLLKDVRFDAHIINDGTLEDLEEFVDAIMMQDWDVDVKDFWNE